MGRGTNQDMRGYVGGGDKLPFPDMSHYSHPGMFNPGAGRVGDSTQFSSIETCPRVPPERYLSPIAGM